MWDVLVAELAGEQGVFAVAPVLDHDPWGKWMGATLTAPDSFLSHGSASTAWEFLDVRQPFVTITRPGSGGPRRHGGVLAFRSSTLDCETTALQGVPITTVPRTLVDLSGRISERRVARGVRE